MLVRPATRDDRERVLDTLVLAFATDPMLRFLAPNDAGYPPFAEGFFGYLFDARAYGGGEVRVTDDLSAASLWNPPGGNRLGAEHVGRLWEERVLPLFDSAGRERLARFETTLDSIHPHEPHWYLGVVGVRPGRQGEGLGGLVIRSVLDDPIAEGLPAYLVTGAESNVPIYRRLGFDVLAETDIEGGPHLWGMWREPAA